MIDAENRIDPCEMLVGDLAFFADDPNFFSGFLGIMKYELFNICSHFLSQNQTS